MTEEELNKIVENLNILTLQSQTDSVEVLIETFVGINNLIVDAIEEEEFERATALRDMKNKYADELHAHLTLLYDNLNKDLNDIMSEKHYLRSINENIPVKDKLQAFIRTTNNQDIIIGINTIMTMFEGLEKMKDNKGIEKYSKRFKEFCTTLINSSFNNKPLELPSKNKGKRSKFFDDSEE